MVKADYLFLMTDVDCLYTDNPRTNPSARPVMVCENIDALRQEIKVTAPGSSLGTGGMVTKLVAADLATAAGVTTIIARGSTPENILPIVSDSSFSSSTPKHTRFVAQPQPLIDRKWWILHGLHTAGTIYIQTDIAKLIAQGAAKQKSPTSLYAHSVSKVEGNFVEHQAVRLVVESTGTVAKGIVNYSAAEIMRIMKADESNIVDSLGYTDCDCIMDSDNMAISI
jgi:glutamate 5-kinase